jgi:hypothetical protein
MSLRDVHDTSVLIFITLVIAKSALHCKWYYMLRLQEGGKQSMKYSMVGLKSFLQIQLARVMLGCLEQPSPGKQQKLTGPSRPYVCL